MGKYWDRLNRPTRIIVGAIVAVILLALCCVGNNYVTDNCKARGGHMEFIYGGKGGWICDGADR